MQQQKKETWRDLRKRARWDRIFGALAFLIMLFIFMILGISSCARKLKKKDPEPVVLETLSPTEPVTEAVVDNSQAVFLSPSTQEDNRYACDESVSEEMAMWEVAGYVKQMLEDDGFTVYICGEDDNVHAKIKQGNHLKCGAYVALHTNSSGTSGDGEGTEIFYNSKIPGSLALAENIYNRVAALTPTDDRGVKDEEQRDLYEIFQNVVPCCLLEVEFHDKVSNSRWILNHTEEIAQAVTEGIEAYLEATKYNQELDTTEEPYYDELAGDY